jgi:hypothetical protein
MKTAAAEGVANGYCNTCSNTGYVECLCGGDICVCGRDVFTCGDCHGLADYEEEDSEAVPHA